MSVNGFRVHREHGTKFDPGDSLGFGELSSCFVSKCRFSNLRVRPITYEPPPVEYDQEDYTRYYREAAEFDDSDAFAHLGLADALVDQRRFEEAEMHLDKFRELVREEYWLRSGVQMIHGLLLKGRGDYADAFKPLQESVATQRFRVTALGQLAWLYASCPDAAYRDGPKPLLRLGKRCKLLRRISGITKKCSPRPKRRTISSIWPSRPSATP